jgi:hypothetical protein
VRVGQIGGQPVDVLAAGRRPQVVRDDVGPARHQALHGGRADPTVRAGHQHHAAGQVDHRSILRDVGLHGREARRSPSA